MIMVSEHDAPSLDAWTDGHVSARVVFGNQPF